MYKRILTLLLPVFVSLAAVIYSVTPTFAAPPYPCATRWERYGEELYEANDRYGSAMALGDLNGDGRADVAIGAPTASHEPSSSMASGKVYVYYSTGPVPASPFDWKGESHDIASRSSSGFWDDHYGHSVAIGQVNGGSYADLAVGVPGSGRVYVYHGSAGGLAGYDWLIETHPPDSANGFSDEFGSSLAWGDINGDGYDDLIVGAPAYDNGQSNEGGVFVWYGSASGLDPGSASLAGANWSTEADQSEAHFGTYLAVGDLNNDGYSDLAVTAPDYDNLDTDDGMIFVWEGSAAGLGTTADWQAHNDSGTTQLGAAKGVVLDDFNGDGYGDLAVANGQRSEVYVWNGSASGLGTTGTSNNTAQVLTGPPGTSYGAALAAGDIDGDGFSDLLIGAPGDDTFSLDTGRVWLRRGSPTNLGSHITGLTQGYATSPSSITAQAQDGLTLASGDVNGDGKADIISGAPHHQAKGLDTGAAYFYNGYDNTAPTAVTISELGGAVDDTWQDAVDDPAFDWTDATDDDRVWRYRTYWGGDPGGSPTNVTDQTEYDPAPPGLGIDYTRYLKVVAEDHACNTTETTYTFRYNGYPAVNNQTFGICDSPFRLWLTSPADWQSCRRIRFDFSDAGDQWGGVGQHYAYFGPDPNGTTPLCSGPSACGQGNGATYLEPGASGTYYFRITADDTEGHLAPWRTTFVYPYDGTPPTAPAAVVTQTAGILPESWNSLAEPGFQWSESVDTQAGVSGYRVYFGPDEDGTDTALVTSPIYTASTLSQSGAYHLRLQALDKVGNSSEWVTAFTYYLDGDDDDDGLPASLECPAGPPCPDTDGDGLTDDQDADDDGDGLATVNEDVDGDGDPIGDDTDGDGIPDYLDADDDGDGLETLAEAGDSDGDGIPDYLEADDDGDGVLTGVECPTGLPCPDTDGDGTPDYQDLDDDGDGIPTLSEDADGDGNPASDDTDGDGTPNYLDLDNDGDGVPDPAECPAQPCQDTDDDGIPDLLDPDDDGDGIPTAEEDPDGDGDPTDDDGDDDGLPDYLDPDEAGRLYLPVLVKER